MVSLFLLLGCNLSYIVDLFAALHEVASASARTLLKLATSVRALLKPYGDTLRTATPQQVHALVQVLYSVLKEYIPFPEENSRGARPRKNRSVQPTPQ